MRNNMYRGFRPIQFSTYNRNTSAKSTSTARKSRRPKQSGARTHAHGCHHKNCGCGGQPGHPAAISQNYACAKKTNSLHNVGSNARGAGIARATRYFYREDREESRAYGHTQARAQPRWAPMEGTLRANYRAQQSSPQQAHDHVVERNHAFRRCRETLKSLQSTVRIALISRSAVPWRVSRCVSANATGPTRIFQPQSCPTLIRIPSRAAELRHFFSPPQQDNP